MLSNRGTNLWQHLTRGKKNAPTPKIVLVFGLFGCYISFMANETTYQTNGGQAVKIQKNTWSIYENMEGQEIEVDGCILRADNFETEEKAEDAMMQMIPAFGGELILQEIYI
jgi:hypothetical protein